MMPISKKADGWYWGSKGPFDTKQKAVQVGQAAHAAGAESIEIKEKKAGKLTFALDYHNTYSADPKFWNVFIELVRLRKDKLYCVTHHTGEKQNQDLLDSIGKVIGKENVIFTMGKAKMDFVKQMGINIDIWIDNNPIHIIENPEN